MAFLVTRNGCVTVLRMGLAIAGLFIVLTSPVLAADDSRYALLVEPPWENGRAIEIGRDAGGLLLRSGWHNAVFYFPEGVVMPGWTADTAILRVSGDIMACSSTTGES